MRKYFTDLKQKTPQAIAPTIVAALIFLITYFCFGAANSMIAPFATLSYLGFRNMKDNLGCMVRHYLIYLVMTLAAFAAMSGLALCILINAAALFWIAYLLINEYQPTNYFPAGMALIFFQIAPVHTLPDLGIRLAALTVSFAIIFAFVLIPSLLRPKNGPLLGYINEAFSVCGQILALTEAVQTQSESSDPTQILSESKTISGAGKDSETEKKTPLDSQTGKDQTASIRTLFAQIEALRPKIRELNHAISMEIYSYNRASLQRKGRVNWFCRFILFFQSFDFLTRDLKDRESLLQAKKLYEKYLDMIQTVTPSPDYKKLTLRYNRPDLRNFRFRFALRMMIVMTPVLVFCYLTSFENVYWLAISVFFMMIPYSVETKRRVKERVTGSIIGILACFVLFTVFPGLPARIVIMSIANFFIYSAGSYASMVAYITCSALAIQTVDAFVLAALGERLLYTLIGAVIALLANKFIFPIRMNKQIEYMSEILFRIRHLLVQLGQGHDASGDSVPSDETAIFVSFGRRLKKADPLDDACRNHQTDQLIIKSYLISKRIEQLDKSMPESMRDPNLPQQELEHMKFMTEYIIQNSDF